MEEGEAAMLVITTTVDGTILTIQENMPSEEEIAELENELNAPFNLVTVINASASAGPITVQFDLESIGFVTLDGLGMDALNFGDAATIPMNDGTELDQSLQVITAGSEAITGALLDAQVAAEEAAIEEQIAEMLDLMLGTDLMLDLNVQSESDFELLVEGMESMDALGTVEGIQADAEASAAEQMVAVEDAVAGVEQPSAEDVTYTIIITGDGSGANQSDITVINQSVTGLMAE